MATKQFPIPEDLAIDKDRALLGGGVEGQYIYMQSPNMGGMLNPDSIVIHYTGGADSLSSARSLSNPDHKASAHLIVGRDNSIIQLVPFNRVAWHAGRSTWKGRSGYNRYSIGIEIDNVGPLDYSRGIYTSWFGREYPENQVFEGVHRNQTKVRFWQRYTEGQITIVEHLCRLLITVYAIDEIVGHEEISPSRKTDPGPGFPLDKLRERIFMARNQDEADKIKITMKNAGVVVTDQLNVRILPDLHETKIGILMQGTRVDILEATEGWYKIRNEGWVSDHFIDQIKII